MNTVTLIKDGKLITFRDNVCQMNLILVDIQIGEYRNLFNLALNSIADYDGMYECIVANSIESQNASLQLKGKIKDYFVYYIISIEIKNSK